MLLATVLVLLLVIFLKQFRKPKNFPPGPFRIPVVGYGPFLENHLPHKQMWRMSAEYNSSVVGVFFGSNPAIFVNGWETVKEALANDDLNGRPDALTIGSKDGERTGVMFVNGDFWKTQRRFSLHHFRNLGFGKRSHESVIHDEAEELIQEFSTIKGPFSIQSPIGVSAINILWSVLGGERFPRSDPRLTDLVNKLNTLFRTGRPNGGVVNIFPAVKYIAPKWSGYETLFDARKAVQDFIEESIEEHKKTIDPENPRDFIDIYLQEIMNTTDPGFTENQLIGICSDVFSAGAETGSSFVTFAIMFMCLYPEVQQRMQRELDEVVGHGRYPSMEDKVSLPYTEATYTEIMRIRCPAPLTVPHLAERDTILQGYRIPKNTLVMVNLYSVLMDADHFEDPEDFRPERFLTKDGKFQRNERLIPFGKGKRICLGEALARTTTFLLFTALVQRFTFTLPPGEHLSDTEGKSGFTLGPPNFQVMATPRYSF